MRSSTASLVNVLLCVVLVCLPHGEAQTSCSGDRTVININFNDLFKGYSAPTPAPTPAPTTAPTTAPTIAPTTAPTTAPTHSSTPTPTTAPTTQAPTQVQTPLNDALSAATADILQNGKWEQIYAQFALLQYPRPSATACKSWPAVSGDLQTVLDSGVLLLGVIPYAPMFIPNNQTVVSGPEAELGREVAKTIGAHYSRNLTARFVLVEQVTGFWTDLLAGLYAKKYDAVLSTVTVRPDRQLQADFSCVYWTNYVGILRGPRNPSLQLQTVQQINSSNATFVLIPSTTPYDLVKQLFPQANIVEVSDWAPALLAGQGDLTAWDKLAFLDIIQSGQCPTCSVNDDPHVNNLIQNLSPQPLGFATRKPGYLSPPQKRIARQFVQKVGYKLFL